MTKAFLLAGSLILLMALVLACGSEPTATPTPEPTATPEPTGKTLEQAAEERSGGPGAFIWATATSASWSALPLPRAWATPTTW